MSALSIYFRYHHAHSNDQFWNETPVVTLLLVEAWTGVIIACMPTAAQTVRRLHSQLSTTDSFTSSVPIPRTIGAIGVRRIRRRKDAFDESCLMETFPGDDPEALSIPTTREKERSALATDDSNKEMTGEGDCK